MKRIEIQIQPFELDEVKDVLDSLGIKEINIYDVRCSNLEIEDEAATTSYTADFMPRVRLDFIAQKEIIPNVISKLEGCLKKNDSTAEIIVLDLVNVIAIGK